jgi:hypothetical protein
MIGNYDTSRLTTVPVDPELAAKFHFDTTIAAQLSRVAGSLDKLSRLDGVSYAEGNDISAPTLIGELATFASAATVLHSEGMLAQQIILDLVSGKELTPKQAVFVQQIKQVSALLDTLQAKDV